MFSFSGKHSSSSITKSLTTPIHMDNIGCYGTEVKLIECAYNTDTSEDSHSHDIWIDCSSSSPASEYDRSNDNNINKGEGNIGSRNVDEDSTTLEIKANVALILVILIMVGLIFVLLAKIGYMIYRRRGGIRQKKRFVKIYDGYS